MSLVVLAARVARRTLDVLLVLLIGLVLVALVIARLVPVLTGGQAFVVGGGSMEPSIPLGSAIVAVPVDPADLAVDDVVSLRVGPERAVFTHRITRLVTRDDGLWLATWGDGNEDPDPSLVPASAVIGRVDHFVPYAGFLIALLGSLSGRRASCWGWAAACWPAPGCWRRSRTISAPAAGRRPSCPGPPPRCAARGRSSP